MFETAIINKLKADSDLTAVLNTYNGEPSIFSNEAPEEAELPFIIIRIDGGDMVDSVQQYNLYVDYYDYNISRVNSRIAGHRIKCDLHQNRLTTDRAIDIRLWIFSGPTNIDSTDIRDVHLNLQFYIRSTESDWLIKTY